MTLNITTIFSLFLLFFSISSAESPSESHKVNSVDRIPSPYQFDTLPQVLNEPQLHILEPLQPFRTGQTGRTEPDGPTTPVRPRPRRVRTRADLPFGEPTPI